MPRYGNSSLNTIDDFLINNDNINNNNIYDLFQQNITVEKIKKLNNIFKKYEKKGMINYINFISCMKNSFDLHNNNNISYDEIYNNIFKRFREKKCILNKNKEILYITNIKNENYIYTYNILYPLCIFLYSDFYTKIKTLFEISDIDEDGLLNKTEIKNMITLVNNLFCDEINLIKINSSILSQSLTNIKVKNILKELFHFLEKFDYYINFETFYKNIIKIKNYKYIILPCCINFKESLLFYQKKEKLIKIKKKYENLYTSFLNDINTDINNNNIYNQKKFYNNIKKIKVGLNHDTKKNNKYKYSFECNYSDIKNIEVNPGIIHIISNEENKNFDKEKNINLSARNFIKSSKNSVNTSTRFSSKKNSALRKSKKNFFKIKINLKKKLCIDNAKNINNNGYKTLEEFMKEIKQQEKIFNRESIKNITKEMVKESKETDFLMKKLKHSFLFRREKPIKRSNSTLYEYLYNKKKNLPQIFSYNDH